MNNSGKAFSDIEITLSDEELYEICAKVEEEYTRKSATIERTLCDDVCKAVEINANVRAQESRELLPRLEHQEIFLEPSTSSAANVSKVTKRKVRTKPLGPKQKLKRRMWINKIDEIIKGTKRTRKKSMQSTLIRTNNNGGKLRISTNAEDGSNATHLIKVEIYDLKKLSGIPASQHWRHATVKTRYYSKGINNKHLVKAKKIILGIANEISKQN